MPVKPHPLIEGPVHELLNTNTRSDIGERVPTPDLHEREKIYSTFDTERLREQLERRFNEILNATNLLSPELIERLKKRLLDQIDADESLLTASRKTIRSVLPQGFTDLKSEGIEREFKTEVYNKLNESIYKGHRKSYEELLASARYLFGTRDNIEKWNKNKFMRSLGKRVEEIEKNEAPEITQELKETITRYSDYCWALVILNEKRIEQVKKKVQAALKSRGFEIPEEPDMLNFVLLAAYRVAINYDSKQGSKYSTYLEPHTSGFLNAVLREMSINSGVDVGELKLGAKAKRRAVSVDDVFQRRITGDNPRDEKDPDNLHTVNRILASSYPSPEEEYADKEFYNIVRDIVDQIYTKTQSGKERDPTEIERNRAIIKLYFGFYSDYNSIGQPILGEGVYKHIGKHFSLSGTRVAQIINEGLKEINLNFKDKLKEYI